MYCENLRVSDNLPRDEEEIELSTENRGLLPGAMILTALVSFCFVMLMLSAGDVEGHEEQVNWLVTGYFSLSVVLLVWGYIQLHRKNVGFFILMCAHLFWFALPAVLTLDEGRYWGDYAHYTVPMAVVAETSIIVLLFLALNLFSYWLFRRRARVSVARARGSLKQTLNFYPTLRWVLLLMFVVGLVPFVVLSNNLGDIIGHILASRSADKPWSMGAHLVNVHGPLVVISRAALVTFSALAIWLWVQRKRLELSFRDRSLLLLGFMLGLSVTYFDSGTRTWTVLIIGPVIITNMLSKLSERRVAIGAVLTAVFALSAVVLVQAQRYYRFTATMEGITAEDVLQLSDTDFFTETAIAVDLVPSRFDFIEQFEPLLFITNPIPRFLWESKPYSQTVRLFSLGRSGYDEYMRLGLSRLPSIIGQHYMSWGYPGVVICAIFWGWAFALFDGFYQTASTHSIHAFFGALGMIWLFTCSRGLYPGFHYPVVLIGLLILFMNWLDRRRKSLLEKVSVEAPAAAT